VSESNPEQAPPPTPTRTPWLVGAILVTILAVTVWFAITLVRAIPPAALDVGDTATVLRVPLPIDDFTLVDHEGQSFDRSRLEDRWSFLYFGYTSCPAVCPMALGNFSDVQKLVTGAPDSDDYDVQFVFVSVDPERDTTERLRAFVPYFHPDFVGATGSAAQLEALTGVLGIYHAKVAGGSELDYLVDHTTSVMLIDPEGQLLAIFPAPHDPGAVAEAFRKIRQRANST
jgi:protein SCO1/2